MNAMIAWFVRNRIAADLITILVFVGGLAAAPQLQREVIPTLKTQRVQILVPYPGASPEEIELGILQAIENAVSEIDGVERTVAMATDGYANIIAEIETDKELRPVMEQIDTRVMALTELPAESERPVVKELLIEQPAINLTIYGDADERTLKNLGNKISDDLLASPEISRVRLTNVRGDEIAIELSDAALTQYGLTFDVVSQLIQASSLDLPAGEMRTPTGNVLLRTNTRAQTGEDYARIEILRQPDGTMVRLGDIATVRDGFAESDSSVTFNGKRAVTLEILRVGDQDVIDVTDAVKAYVEQLKPQLPAGLEVAIWRDFSVLFHGRINTLVSNGIQGIALVFLVLILFMRPQIAFWVTSGVVLTFLGTLGVMFLLGISLNMVSLFGFILVLGTLVDDGIVVGEAIYVETERGLRRKAAAIAGATSVCWPVIVSVFTNIQTFIPILNLPGVQAQIWAYVPMVVIIAYLVSLVESLLCLPAHLAHMDPIDPQTQKNNWLYQVQSRFAGGLDFVAQRGYQPVLLAALRQRWVTLAIFVGIMMVTVGLLAGGKVKVVFFPAVVSDSISADITLDGSVPVAETERAVRAIEEALARIAAEADAMREEGEPPTVLYTMRSIGEANDPLGLSSQTGTNVAQLYIEMAPAEQRHISTDELVQRWRASVLNIPYVRDVSFNFSLNRPGPEIDISLISNDNGTLAAASRDLKIALSRYPGVYEIGDSERALSNQIEFSLRPEAEAIGLTAADLGRQLRQGYFGEEVQQVQRQGEEVPVVIRYDRASRSSETALEQLSVRASDGAALPLTNVATLSTGEVKTMITRINGARTIEIFGSVNPDENDAGRVKEDLELNVMPLLLERYPGLRWEYAGSAQEESKVKGALGGAALISLTLIFATVAVLFRSYVQALLIFTVLPFAVIGAIFAHIIFGITLSMLSMAGIIAALGVCVNDSVVLIDYVNTARKEGLSRDEAIRRAGLLRFRPIILTTVTTFVGLSTLLLEKSAQAQVLIPMATSLAWAVLITTFVALLLLPVLISLVWSDQMSDDEEVADPAAVGARH